MMLSVLWAASVSCHALRAPRPPAQTRRAHARRRIEATPDDDVADLYDAAAAFTASVLDPDDAADMGVREWPFSQRPAEFEETVPAGARRYVLQGTGAVEASNFAGGARCPNHRAFHLSQDFSAGWPSDRPNTGGVATAEPVSVGPGSLVETTEQCNLRWVSDDGGFVVPSAAWKSSSKRVSPCAHPGDHTDLDAGVRGLDRVFLCGRDSRASLWIRACQRGELWGRVKGT